MWPKLYFKYSFKRILTGENSTKLMSINEIWERHIILNVIHSDPCVCACVCVRQRERMREGGCRAKGCKA